MEDGGGGPKEGGGGRPSRTWWPDGPMRAKAPRMVQGLSLLLLAFIYLLLNDFCCKYMLNLCKQLNTIYISMNMI
jgi:hypothetical protein